MHFKFLLSVALLVFGLTSALAQPTLGAVDEVVAPYVGTDAPGIAVLVMRRGEIIHMKGYGFSDVENQTPVDQTTIFDLASVSKQMTAMAARMQIAEGRYGEDSAVADVLPLFVRDSDPRPLTIGDLIRHLGGLPDYLAEDQFDEASTNADVIEWAAAQPLDHAPGVKWEYSNIGYLVLANAVATADDASDLKAVLQKRIWTPLGMRSTALAAVASGVSKQRVARGYKGLKGRFKPSEEKSIVQGDGNVMTDLEDLAAYEAALSKHRLLDPEQTAALFTNGATDDGEPVDSGEGDGYGYGWNLEEADGVKYAIHDGSWMGTSTVYRRNLTSGVTIIVLSNGEDLAAWPLAAEIEDAIAE